MQSFIRKPRIAGVLALTLMLAVLAGCSGHTPAGPQAQSEQFIAMSLGELDEPALATKPVVVTQEVSAADGGTVILAGTVKVKGKHVRHRIKGKASIDYEYALAFPPGALDEDTAIRLTTRDRGTVKFWLDPHGIHFNVPVTLTIKLSSQDLPPRALKKTLDIYWFDEAHATWVPLGAHLEWDGQTLTATVQLHHFSQYSLGGYGPIQKMYFQSGWGYPGDDYSYSGW